MNILAELQKSFRQALVAVAGERLDAAGLDELVEMVRPSQDAKFGDYQANCAMPLAKKLAKPPREVAAALVERLIAQPSWAAMCEPPEIAGPGFINQRIRTEWLSRQLAVAARDERLGVAPVEKPRTVVIDYSAPNVAKPMHVGHIRSTVIGDSLYRIHKFLGHRVIGDNHIGDWGTQFGMIIYGYKNFLDRAAFEKNPVDELARLYRFVNRLVSYFEGRAALPGLQQRVARAEAAVQQAQTGTAADDKKKHEKALRQAQKGLADAAEELAGLQASLAAVEADPVLSVAAAAHPDIAKSVLRETAWLHEGDPTNLALWKQFLPPCLSDIDRIYRRLGVTFDHTLGESFYHDRLSGVVADLLDKGIAKRTEGAIGVFSGDQPDAPPFLIQKQGGAFLYGTTDLAAIQYRMETWQPDAILYVVDHRQSLHFAQLFATARRWGYTDVELQHVSFGTVLGDDGRPFKARSGETVGLESLLDEAVERALAIVSANDDAKPDGPELSADERQRVAEAVGIGALKYADLSQNRTSDYVFSYDKMLAMQGNTATYMQYAHARVRSIFARARRAGVSDGPSEEMLVRELGVGHPAERALALELLRFSEALDAVLADYRPNHLTTYMFELANRFSTFFEQCPVIKADTPEQRRNRLALCDLTARTLRLGLSFLGIEVVEKM